MTQVQKVRRRMLAGDKRQTFVSGDAQPGRPIEPQDVAVKDHDEGHAARPTLDPTRPR